MILKKNYLRCFIVAPVLICCFLMSCVSTQKAVYFNNLPDTVIAPLQGNFEPVIQKNDILQITVSSLNPEDATVFNAPVALSATSSNSPAAAGYLVSEQGFIQYPVLGQVKAAGLTKEQLTNYLRDELNNRKLMKDPVVSIRLLNYRVTVLGEVGKPTVVNVTNEKITILEALGMAGDITIYGKKDNVLLIRDVDGQRTVKRLNLNSDEIFSSQYYYLKSNDIVYVEPVKAKVVNAQGNRQTIALVLSGLSVLVVLMAQVIFK